MSYLVVECHLSYAVVLDEEGRAFKVANMQYQVGQTVTDVMPMQIPKKWYINKRKIYSVAFVAACFVMLVTSFVRLESTTYASVYMTINPSVRIDVNRREAVIGVAGVNEDGDALVKGYRYEKKELETVLEELLDRSIEMEYLHAGVEVTLKMDTEDEKWIAEHQDNLTKHVEEYVETHAPVIIVIEETVPEEVIPETPMQEESEPEKVVQETVAPVQEETPPEQHTESPQVIVSPENDGDTDYGPNNDGVTDYDDTDYGPGNDGVTDYDSDDDDDDSDDDDD